MKYAFVIEDEEKFFLEVKEALGAIDPNIEVRNYHTLEEFVDWIRSSVDKKRNAAAQEAATEVPAEAPVEGTLPAEGAAAPPTAKEEKKEEGPIELVLLVCKSEFLKHKGFSLLQKTREYFISRGICTRELPTAFVLTAFDTGAFDYSKYENQIVSNIIFKPFDKLILRAHLRVALAGGKAQKSEELYTQKTQSRLEMLKDVHIEELSETGFATRSEREIIPGTMAKYYSAHFQSGRLSSIYASAIRNEPHPKIKGAFRCYFSFFNVIASQVSVIRRSIKADKKFKVLELKPPQVTRDINFINVAPKESGTLEPSITSSFQNAKFINYHDFVSFAYDVDPGDSLNPTKSKDKPLPAPQMKVLLDLKHSKIVAYDPPAAETAAVLGTPAKATVDKESIFTARVYSEDRARWLQFFKQETKSLPKPLLFRFRMQDERLVFLKAISHQKIKHEKLGEVYQFEIAEASDQEKKDFLLSLSQLPKKIDALFIDRAFMTESPNERWTAILTLLKERAPQSGIKLFLMSGSEVSSEDLIDKHAPFNDVFAKPFDGPYICKKLKEVIPELKSKDPMEIASREYDEIIKAAQPVKAISVSEAGLSIDYYRQIDIGNFRKVVLWMPHEIGLPEFLISCNAVEEVEENKQKRYICHFIFFGVRDDSLSHIRRWIKEYYVHHKEAQ